MRTLRILTLTLSGVAVAATVALLAMERPLAGDLLRLTDPPAADKQSGTFRANNDPAVDPAGLADPRQVGATLRVWGSGEGDGDSGEIALPAAQWIGLGRPAGSQGYQYRDRAASAGVRTVTIRKSPAGGTLVVKTGGANWPYRITQQQGTITVNLTLGDDTFCSKFTTFNRNEAKLVVSKRQELPGTCQPEACGNAALEAGEECDDGNLIDGDGCSALCQLQAANALCAGVTTSNSTTTDLQPIVTSGLSAPVHLTSPPLDVQRLFVVEQEGRIRIVKNGVLLSEPFLNIESLVGYGGERGLLSLAFHPDFANNRRFFVNYTDKQAGRTTIARFTRSADDPDRADPDSRVTLLTIDQPYANHNGGQIAFGPDGYLYIGMGDGGNRDDPLEAGQAPTELLAKMLRMDVNVDSAPFYRVPPDNPRAGDGLRLGLIWSKGLRNPWRFAFDRDNGDLYVADVGQDKWEEIDWRPGSSRGNENYGWDIFEGNACFEPQPQATNCPSTQGFVMPVHVMDHNDGYCSVTGGHVYRGCRMPNLRGRYFYSDFCASMLQSFRIQNGNRTDPKSHAAAGLNQVASFGEDARGELYVINLSGQIYKLVPR
jgi:cysteine-rich repeat protein